jgi:RHS repeat-associated protein
MDYDQNGVNHNAMIYGRGVDELVARGADGVGWFYFPDRNGNISVVTDGVNTVRESYRYDAFGAPTVTVGPGQQAINNRFLFTGREWNATYGFYEYRSRAYNPTLGRFMSEDPKGFDAGDYNLYRYCNNDPLDLADPTGEVVTLVDPYNKTAEVYDKNVKIKSAFAQAYEKGRDQATHNKDGTINETASKAFKTVEGSKNVNVTITRTNKLQYDPNGQFKATYDPKTGWSASFDWNPNAARINTNLTRNSPGAVLVHETWHGERIATSTDPIATARAFRRSFGEASPEENRVLELEQQVFPQLRNEGVRSDLNFQRFFYVSDPSLGGRQ